MRYRAALVVAVLVGGLLPSLPALGQVEEIAAPAARETEPVILTGASFPEWTTVADQTAKAPGTKGTTCLAVQNGFPETPFSSEEDCSHNQYEDPDASSQSALQQQGADTTKLLGYRWDDEAGSFVQIPFQVDEMFTRYLSNNNSGFAFYSETDQHNTYAFDREGFRWTDSDPENPCLAQPASEVARDPVPGLDTDDEVAFMASDAGVAAPDDAPLPPGIDGSYRVQIADPTDPGNVRYAYVMLAGEDGPAPAFDASNGYVRYERDADANYFLFSESNYEDYGATFHGPWLDPQTGICHSDESEYKQHRPSDKATISTPRYRFRYEGRWLMTDLHVSKDDDWTYGPDIVDQWKARAFQQRPSGETPCCGFEEEVNNWGGSSILMGERSGPVRTIRETWGADSGTNVVRRETFYRDEIRQASYLRVHVIPPADGIYAQWDYNAGMVSTYFNPENPDGVAIDGKNDEVFGNSKVHVGPDGFSYEGDDEVSDQIEEANGGPVVIGDPAERGCDKPSGYPDEGCIANDIDTADPTFSGPNAGLNWEEIAGPNGTLITRTSIKQVTPGSGQGVIAIPYYRDDACFDDGTGSNPGPHLHGHGTDDGAFGKTSTGEDRRCWDSATDPVPDPAGDERFFQGSVGTHGVHILFIAESDNARTTVPVTEIDSEQRIVVLQPTLVNVGERYGRGTEKPLVVASTPEAREQASTPEPTATPTPTESPTSSPTPTKTDTQLAFTDESSRAVNYTDPAQLVARLTDSSGNGLADQTITFELRGESFNDQFETRTDVSGTATWSLEQLEPGAYEAIVHFAGNDEMNGSAESSSLVVNPEITQLSLTRAGNDLIASLTDDESNPVPGRTITFILDDEVIGTAVTGDDGVATFTVPKKQRGDKKKVRAVFEGDKYYSPSSAEQAG